MKYIGIDIGGTSIKGAFVNAEGEILQRFTIDIIKGERQEDALPRIAKAINAEIEASGSPKDDFAGVGIGCPGSINSKLGVCNFSNNLHWANAPIVETISSIVGLPAKVSNDANVAALGEAKFGAGKNYQDVILVTLGTGVGGGIILGGKLFEGREGMGAEIGHMIIQVEGAQCTCGLRGCLESYASATALVRDTRIAMSSHPESLLWEYVGGDLQKVNARAPFECAKKGDETALAVIDRYEDYLTVGLINYCNIFRPDAIIIGGGLSNQKEYLLEPLRKKLKSLNYGYRGTPSVDLLVSNLGNDAGALGAAALFME